MEKQLLDSIRFVQTKTVLMSQIVFDKNNPNVMSEEKHKAFDKVIKKYGFAKDPWLNEQKDGTYLVIDGEQGIKRLQEHGVKKFQAKIFRVSYTEVRILRQIANKLHGEHDKKLDALEFKAIFEDNKLDNFADFLAEPIEDFQIILEKNFDIHFEKEEEEIPEPPKKPKSKLGEVYQLGNHRIMCGDSTKDSKTLLNGIEISLGFTDPPFNIDYQEIRSQKRNIKNDKMKPEEFNKFLLDALSPLPKTNYVCCNWKSISVFENVMNELELTPKACIVWDKEIRAQNLDRYFKQHEFILYSGPFGGQKTICGDIWRYQRKYSAHHPTAKPIEMISQAIRDSSNVNEIVYDPFLGSGSTLIACEQTNRICYGMEIDPGYIDVIIERWQNYTNKKAVKL